MSFLVHNQWKTYLTCSFESRSAMAAAPATSTYGPSAPPANMFDTFPGYEGTVAGGGGKHASYVKQEKRSSKHCSMRKCPVSLWIHILSEGSCLGVESINMTTKL